MRKLWDFHGGIHPPDNKVRTTVDRIRDAGLPQRLIVPLQQHIGAPAQCLVSPGTIVAKGQQLAAAQGDLSAAVHAPTSGRIAAIEPHPVPHPSGLDDWCVILEPDGADRWVQLDPCPDFSSAEPEALLERIRDAGISGLGGAGFPTAFKLDSAENRTISTLIINGAECEPYITADQMLMQERPEEVVGGIQVLLQILQPHQCLLAVEDNKPRSIEAMQRAAAGTEIEVVTIPTRYPSGGEKQLIEILTGQQVPHGGLPADLGIICQNVGTAAAIFRAVCVGEPLISRVTTLAGEALARPGNYDVLIGTPIADLLQCAGLHDERLSKVVLGGPMMGFAVTSTGIPVTKTTNCVIAATAQEFPEPKPAQPCIRCGLCEQVCPMELLPQQLLWYSRSGQTEKAEALDLFDCIECGACDYVCPSTIPLVQQYRATKGQILEHRAEQLKADQARARFEARQQRIAREQAEKEARRLARKSAAAGTPEPSQRKASSRADAVKAALARAQAKQKPPGQPMKNSSAPPDVTALEMNLTRTRVKLQRMEADLAVAQGSDATRAAKLEEAIAGNRARLKTAEEALAAAMQKSDPVPAGADQENKDA